MIWLHLRCSTIEIVLLLNRLAASSESRNLHNRLGEPVDQPLWQPIISKNPYFLLLKPTVGVLDVESMQDLHSWRSNFLIIFCCLL